MSALDRFSPRAGESKVGRASRGEGDVAAQGFSAGASQSYHFMVGHSLAHAKDHPLHTLRSLHAGVFKVGDFRSRAESTQTVAGMHQQIGTVHDTLVSRKIAKSVHQIGRQLDRVFRMRMLLIREILPAHASDHGCRVNPITRKYLPNPPALVSWLIEQGKGLEPFPSQLSVAK